MAALVFALLSPAFEVGAQTLLTQGEAIELAFPGAEVERRTAFLGEEELRRASELAGHPVESRVVTYYLARSEAGVIGAAYFDAHVVRTVDEVLMVVVGSEGQVERVEVLRFSEPPDYLAPDGWLAQFEGRRSGPDLSVGRGIVNMTGATLTSRAATSAVRRVLALHEVIAPFGDR
jgi:Na+-translocating ferredoxin:NAD+ oxidoreductase RnfG subunit